MLAGVRDPNGESHQRYLFPEPKGCARDDTTEASVVLDRIAAGDEIAVHTVTHSTSDTTSFTTWRREISGVLRYLDGLGIPRQQRGFRDAVRGDQCGSVQDVLQTLGILYDWSVYDSPFFQSGLQRRRRRHTGPTRSIMDQPKTAHVGRVHTSAPL